MLLAVSALILFLFTFAIRIPFTMGRTGDEWISNYIIEQQRRKPLTCELPDAVKEGSFFGYPPLFFWLVTLFPRRASTRWGILLGLFFDAVLAVILFGLAFAYCSQLGFGSNRSYEIAVLVGMLYSTSPLLMPAHARLAGIKARTFGSFLFFLYFIFLGLGMLKHPAFHGAALVAGVLTIWGAQMALQGLAFGSLFLAILLFDPRPLAVYAAVLLIGWFLPFGPGKPVLRMRIAHMWWYRRNMKYSGVVERRNRLKDLLSLPADLLRNFRKALATITANNSILILLTGMFTLPVFISFWWLTPLGDTVSSDPALRYSWAISLAMAGASVLTSTRPFLYLGEAERYMEFALPFFSFLFVVSLRDVIDTPVMILLIAAQLTLTTMNFCYWMHNWFNQTWGELENDPHMLDVIKALESQKRTGAELRVVAYPSKLSYQIACMAPQLGARFVHLWMCEKSGGLRDMENDFPEYFFPRKDLDFYHRKYGVSLCVLGTNYLNPPGGQFTQIGGFPVLYQNKKYAILRLVAPPPISGNVVPPIY